MGRHITLDYLGRHRRVGGGRVPAVDGEPFAAHNGTDVARSSQRRRGARPSRVAGPIGSARSGPKCASVMVVAVGWAHLGPRGRTSRMVSTDFRADAAVVFRRDATSYTKSVAPGASAGGFSGVRCVV